jgi:hypothetical protein
MAVLVDEFLDGDHPFGLVAHIDHHLRGGHLQDGALDHFSFGEVAETVVVEFQQSLILFWIDLVVVDSTSFDRSLRNFVCTCH